MLNTVGGIGVKKVDTLLFIHPNIKTQTPF